jgi:hypothetical protein
MRPDGHVLRMPRKKMLAESERANAKAARAARLEAELAEL